nr:hypothetical protein [Janibacter limosus]
MTSSGALSGDMATSVLAAPRVDDDVAGVLSDAARRAVWSRR